jgi:SH3-like domain-containing protein
MVYVSIRTTYLHDRVAPVSNRVCEVVNGQPLEVLEHGKRFLRVKTDKNETGWIEERAVIDQKTYDGFVQLGQQHKDDPGAATATLRDDLAMHLLPGRETPRFYLLAGNDKVQLLARASALKNPTETSVPFPLDSKTKPAPPANPKAATAPSASGAPNAAGAEPVAPPVIEDWWLARDAQGRVGWLLASRLDVDAPDQIAEYAEGKRIVGAWVLAKVTDSESDVPDHQVPEYLTMLDPLQSGLPFDFDEVRVFTWSVKHHRYETGFRLHPIQGYLPVHVFTAKAGGASVPAFSFQIAANNDVKTDPASGITQPVTSRTINYDMIDTQVKRIGPDMAPLPVTHEPGENKPEAKAKGKRKH